MLNGIVVLLTGGTGSFGKKFVERVVKDYPEIRKLIVFSRDELKQFEMAQIFPESKYAFMRYFIGDIRDLPRFKRACEGVDIIVHAAALKQVPVAEYNPMEFIKTNILGAQNVIEASLDTGVKMVTALSTDKAAAPINLYGATKLCSDKLFVAANNIKGSRNLKYSVVRYGNVIGSRGSVVPFYLEKRKTGVLPITNPEMTRFNITLEQGIDMVLYSIANGLGGEIFVPKIPSYRILDLAQAIGPNCRHEIIGIRPGEKLHEEMITETDSYNTIEFDKYYAIIPTASVHPIDEYIKHFNACKVPIGFRYNSGQNTQWLSVDEIREQIRLHVDRTFSI